MGSEQLKGTISTSGQLSCSLSSSPITGELTISGSIPAYTGSYEATPSDSVQTLPVSGWLMAQDITINPIPSNYGKISWDGTTLTVS